MTPEETEAWLDRWVPVARVPNGTWNISGPEAAYHLISNEGGCCDGGEVWCGDDVMRLGYTRDPSQVGCRACLEAAERYGERCFARLADLALSGVLDAV
jgi:hypothetical protein